MELKVLCCFNRSATLCIEDGGLYAPMKKYTYRLNGGVQEAVETAVFSLYALSPDTEYNLALYLGESVVAACCFHTKKERYTLNVRAFGAKGDGRHDDTAAIEAAIMACPQNSRVLIPEGRYSVKPLFLKSGLRLEIQKGAELMLCTKREDMPILPGMLESWDEKEELCLGTWEGNPLSMYAALLTGLNVHDVVVYGEGILNGCAPEGDWWETPKIRRGAWRGRLLFLNRCEQVTFQGLHFCNSPSWNIHPFFSNELQFLNIHVSAPQDSPNTDGFDPESCRNVLLAGAHFSLGDDCVAIKSGKLYLGKTLKTPCENLEIAHCLMENGHGGVTVGSEMAGGVKHVHVRNCLMRHTDRGLRIKTRRGRGRDGIIDDIAFENVRMENVGVPCTVNALYACDPDGHTEYVQSTLAQRVDERTPRIGHISFAHVEATGCEACAGYVLGLPEMPVEEMSMEDVAFSFSDTPRAFAPVMADCASPCAGKGLIIRNVRRFVLKNVSITGVDGEKLVTENVAVMDNEGGNL